MQMKHIVIIMRYFCSIISQTGRHDVECEYPLLYIPQEVDSGIISLQLLEFQTMWLEAVEELHIHRVHYHRCLQINLVTKSSTIGTRKQLQQLFSKCSILKVLTKIGIQRKKPSLGMSTHHYNVLSL